MTPRWRTTLRVRALLHTLLDSHVPMGVLAHLVGRINAHADSGLVAGYQRDLRGTLGGVAFELVQQLVDDESFGDASLLYAVEAALLGARGRLVVDESAAECIESIDEVLVRLGTAKLPPTGSKGAADDGWHGQREKWRDLIEHLRARRGDMQRRADAGDECAGVVHDELQGVLTFIGQQQPDPRPPGEPRDLLRIADELRRRRVKAWHAFEGTGDQGQNAVVGELDELIEFVGPLMGAPLPDVERFEQYLDGEGFYNLMQAYRHANVVQQGEVAAAFETIKTVLREQVRR